MLLRLCGAAALALCGALFASVGAAAAVVSSQAGTVLISKDDGFVPLLARSEVAAGTRVMVRPGGSALIAYAGNCAVLVGSGLWLVQEKAPCREGVALIDFTGRMNQEPATDEEPPRSRHPGSIRLFSCLAAPRSAGDRSCLNAEPEW